MENILGELQSKTGVIGSIIIGENGSVLADCSIEPENLGVELQQKLEKFFTLSHKNNKFDYIICEGEKGKILVYNLSEKLLLIFVTRTANPLLIHSIVKKNFEKLVSKPAEAEAKKEQIELEKPQITVEAKKPTILADIFKPTKQPQTTPETETEKPKITLEEIIKLTKTQETEKTIETPEEPEAAKAKTQLKSEPIAAKPKLEELGKAILNVNSSGFKSNFDLIVHLRKVYGDKRFLASRLLEYSGKELRVISREIKMSIEEIIDFVERDTAVFSIEFHR